MPLGTAAWKVSVLAAGLHPPQTRPSACPAPADLNLKILRDDSSCPGACQVIRWVKGCFDALDKKYVSVCGCVHTCEHADK